jgi:hypothetical protein
MTPDTHRLEQSASATWKKIELRPKFIRLHPRLRCHLITAQRRSFKIRLICTCDPGGSIFRHGHRAHSVLKHSAGWSISWPRALPSSRCSRLALTLAPIRRTPAKASARAPSQCQPQPSTKSRLHVASACLTSSSLHLPAYSPGRHRESSTS